MTPIPFVDSARFTLEGRLGAGAMGVVYRVFDRERGHSVALKTLGQVGPEARFKLKQEFRSFADLRHPGLVRLFDLFASDESSYFTMELVVGLPFTEFFRATEGPRSETDGAATRALRPALLQLAEALSFLHGAGKLHRDVKPSNLLITAEGRVVLLDFGLSQDIRVRDASPSYEERLVAGTPAYMAPEQVSGNPASTASDWYAFGVVLFETLTDTLPFSGTVEAIFSQKRSDSQPALPKGLPDDLAGLCLELLARSPSKRPRATQILKALGARRDDKPNRAQAENAFIGRSEHISRLTDALAQARAGSPTVVAVSGASGAGKTALVRHFCDTQLKLGTAYVLWGRCHPRETIPFRALDAAVDELSHLLRKDRAARVTAPRHVGPLCRLFPALRRVVHIDEAPKPRAPSFPISVERVLAFDAFAELLARVCDQRPSILVIDDAQFGDADSAELLNWILSKTDAPATTVVFCYDSGAPMSEFVETLRRGPKVEISELGLGELNPIEANQLAEHLLFGATDSDSARAQTAESLATASGGHPETLVALAEDVPTELRQASAHARASSDETRKAWLARSLKEKLRVRTPTERGLLGVLSVALNPLSDETLESATVFSADDCRSATQALLQARLLKRFRTSREDLLQLTGTPFRELVRDSLTPAQQTEIHSSLAASLLKHGDPANAGRHFSAAGDKSAALSCYLRALEHALASMALESALSFAADALACTNVPKQRVPLLVQQAACHEKLGRPASAAEALSSAAALSDLEQANVYLKRALVLEGHAEQFAGLGTGGESSGFNLFDSLPQSSIERIIGESEIVHAEPGVYISRAGHAAEDFLFLLSGTVELRQPALGEMPIGKLHQNELVGEVGFLLRGQRQVDVVVASAGTRVLRVSRQALDELALVEPRVALQLVLNLARVVCGKLLTLRQRILPKQGTQSERPGST